MSHPEISNRSFGISLLYRFVKKIKTLGEVSISRTGALAMNKGAETVKDNKGKVL